MLLGWIAGEVIVSDPVIEPFLHRLFDGRIALTIDELRRCSVLLRTSAWMDG